MSIPTLENKIVLGGMFQLWVYENQQHFDDWNGFLKDVLEGTFRFQLKLPVKPKYSCGPNGIVNGALNDIESVYLGAGTQKTTWYLGLVDNAAFSAFAAADTIASHSGWAESSAYSESVRQTWTPGAAASGIITNPTAANFTANATVTIKGGFLVSNSTKGGTTGQLWATGAFASNQALVNAQVLSVKYTLTATGA